MKTKAYGLLAMVVGLVLLMLPARALAHDHDGWRHHDHGHHYGWYKHHGYDHGWYGRGWYGRGWYRHHDRDDYDRDDYGGYWGPYNSYNPGYYPGPVPPIAVPWSSSYGYSGGYNVNAPRLMQLQQTMSQRLSANQALYQAAMARGDYPLANKASVRMRNEQATINQANAELNGAASPAYPSYYGQNGYSPLSALTGLLGY